MGRAAIARSEAHQSGVRRASRPVAAFDPPDNRLLLHPLRLSRMHVTVDVLREPRKTAQRPRLVRIFGVGWVRPTITPFRTVDCFHSATAPSNLTKRTQSQHECTPSENPLEPIEGRHQRDEKLALTCLSAILILKRGVFSPPLGQRVPEGRVKCLPRGWAHVANLVREEQTYSIAPGRGHETCDQRRAPPFFPTRARSALYFVRTNRAVPPVVIRASIRDFCAIGYRFSVGLRFRDNEQRTTD